MQNSKGDASISMEKFEIDGERKMELFGGFVGRAKEALANLIDSIKLNIKDYEQKIEDTSKEVADNELSREKCEHEITKMENKIDVIKDAIENVESTYKKIVDAYSSTSKGETKELYSEIIDGAKANCEKDVEKNRSEIARLNSDIEAIKNNISEFTKIIDELNRDLDNYSNELYRYNKSLEYLEKTFDKTTTDLEEISNDKKPVKKTESKSTSKSTTTKRSTTATRTKTDEVEEVIEEKKVPKEEPKKEEVKPVKTESSKEPQISFEDSLKQIYDLTGYDPNKKEEVKEAPKMEAPVYTENLENLFARPSKDVTENTKEDKVSNDTLSFLEDDISNWESILNTPSVEPAKDSNVKPISESVTSTVNELLTPYGTSFTRLKSLTRDEITHKDGSKVPFDITPEDVIKAVNSVDGNDLKAMKTVGPEITLLRKIKSMKEGK